MKAAAILVLGALTSGTQQAQSRSLNVGDAVINYEITGSSSGAFPARSASSFQTAATALTLRSRRFSTARC